MLRALFSSFRRPAIRFGMKGDARGRFRNPRFASFISEWNRRPSNTDFQGAILRGRRLAKRVLVLGAVAGGAWIVLESAKALTMF